ncbi:MAG: LuxR C-terminal-related transcriptional regulator [Muribaculaceae bacterium]|nr:LuxR C-terminal-related transcriptional regulator [Muribaculaceae bacterium]
MEIKVYAKEHRMRDLIADNSLLLMAISRFALPLRMANRTVEEVCTATGVDPDTFVCVANMISGKPYDPENVDLASLMAYLKRAHAFFLDFFLPAIRRKIIGAIDYARSHDTALIILRFFDEYVGEVRRHMDYENSTLFQYIESLLAGKASDSPYSIADFAAHHDAISEKLSLLKDVLIRYSPEGNADTLNSALFDIINCEADLISHCEVEDKILVPAVSRAEAAAAHQASLASAVERHGDESEPAAEGILGKREKEIVVCIAKGMSNKEIADRLCISVHTVTTHRRNICAKLEIHSPAGLTIYAILNGLIDPKEIDI